MALYTNNPRDRSRRALLSGFNVLSYSPIVAVIPGIYGTFTDTAGTTPTTADGQSVACAKDGSGNTLHATQGTSGQRPTVQTTNGKKVLRFDGSNDVLAGSGLTMGAARSVFIGFKFANTSSVGSVAQLGTPGANGSITRLLGVTGTMQIAGHFSDVNTFTYDTGWHLGGFRHKATSPSYVKDNGAITSLSNLTVSSFSNQAYAIGDVVGGGAAFNGDLAFMVAFDRDMSDADFQAVQAGLLTYLP